MLLKGRVQEYGVPYLGERGRCLQIASAIIGFLSDPGIPGVRSMGASVSIKVGKTSYKKNTENLYIIDALA